MISNVHVTFHGDSPGMGWSVGWDTAEARYHVWLDAPGKPRSVVYKNPLRGTTPTAPGYYMTRRLSLKSVVNLRMVGEALRIAREADLYAKATEAATVAEAKRLAAVTAAHDLEDREALTRILHKFVERGRIAQAAAQSIIDAVEDK